MQLDVNLLKTEYDSKIAILPDLVETVQFILQKEITRNKIKIHFTTTRIKGFDSFLGKIRRKNITEPFKNIHDLVGLRIVCLFLPDIKLIGDIIQKEFDVLEEDNKVNNSELDIFGYMSLHYKVKLKADSGNEGLGVVKETHFEIQVRTIAQDAWASVSHYLDYKQENFLPDHLRRDFHALSGLFYIADTHFSMLKQEQLKVFVEKTLPKADNQ